MRKSFYFGDAHIVHITASKPALRFQQFSGIGD